VSLFDRIRRLWSSPSPPDHPLDARERDEDRPSSGHDEKARALESLARGDFDPDDDPAHR
jgi:hypothetical protein